MEHDVIAADLHLPIKVMYGRFHRSKTARRRILEQDAELPGRATRSPR
jgi:hypothetical protein